MLRFFDLANALTLGSLLAGLAVAVLSINGHSAAALIALILSGLFDLFDGFVARRLDRGDEQERFGGALDSLVDGCAFGFAPSVMLYCAGLQSPYELVLLALLPICVVWRVAYFEVVGLSGADEDRRYYTGLPATYVALVLPLISLLALVGPIWHRVGSAIAVLLLCGLMVSTVRVRKPGGAAYVFFLLLAVAVGAILCACRELVPTSMLN